MTGKKLRTLIWILAAVLALLLMLAWRLGNEKDAGTTDPQQTPSSSSAQQTTAPATTSGSMPSSVPSVPMSVPTQPSTVPKPVLRDEDFVRVVDYIPTVRQHLRYATTDNFTGQVIYGFTDAYLRWGTVQKLIPVCAELEQLGLGILIWDGYRPTWAQQKLWDVCPDPTYVSPPGTGTQSHCRGIAVDITLYDLQTGVELQMPSDFDEFSAQGDRDYSDCTPEAAKNARLLEDLMIRFGFQAYRGEWWHFSDTVSYPVEDTFDPALAGG